MLFLVPDSETPSPGGMRPEAPQPDNDRDKNTGDTAQGTPSASNDEDQSASIKVELDLDDAPFLNDFEEEAPTEEEEAPKVEETEELELPAKEVPQKTGLLANKKKLIALAGALCLIIAGAAGAFFFFFSGDAEPEAEPDEKRRVVVVTPPAGEATAPVQVVELKPFVIPSKGSEGEIRLLHCTLNIPYDDPVQSQEIGARMLEIRNAIYYYLVNKPLSHLSSEEEAALLKQDLVNVINELLTIQKINGIYIQEYVVTAP